MQCKHEIFVGGDCLKCNTTQFLCITAYEQDFHAMCEGDDGEFKLVFDAYLFDACAAFNVDSMTRECIQPLSGSLSLCISGSLSLWLCHGMPRTVCGSDKLNQHMLEPP